MSMIKESTCQCRKCGFDPWDGKIKWQMGRSNGLVEEDGNPFQCSCLGNSMVRGAQQSTDHGITKSWTRLSNLNNNMIKTTPLTSETSGTTKH